MIPCQRHTKRQRPSLTRSRFAALFCLFALPAISAACPICIPFPKKSAADYLIEGETVVYAREDPARPFHYRATKELKGITGKDPIDLFLDSGTRRFLKAFPDRAVVLVRSKTAGGNVWRRVGIADETTMPVIHTILDSATRWEKNSRDRFNYFATRLDHDHPEVRSLAHLEVARAPYRQIRELKNVLPRESIHAFLSDVRHVEWHALYILLLAQSENPADRNLIHESLRDAARFSATSRLAAWATAAIEIDGEKTLEFLDSHYFRNPRRSPEEMRAVLSALAVHGSNGHTHLRDRIVSSYGIALQHHSSIAPVIVDSLIAWNRSDHARQIADYLKGNPIELDFKTSLRLRAYARRNLPAKSE